MPNTSLDQKITASMPFVGLAPFLRLSIAGTDLRPITQELLQAAQDAPEASNLWMNLSIALMSLGQHELGLAVQAQALEQQRLYHLPATQQPARMRLLMLMAPGDLAANIPLECLLEDSDIDLLQYYITPGNPLAQPLPEHDALIVCMSEADENRGTLVQLETELQNWPKPVLNAPQYIVNTGRTEASQLLWDAPGVVIPSTLFAPRAVLQQIAQGTALLPELSGGIDFPVILRPVGSHAGRDLDKVGNPQEVAAYLAKVNAPEFFLAPFIDYSGSDGQFRKYRIALINGTPFACHMGISGHWMVHYVNAGMYEDADKRAEEIRFMDEFDDFALRHEAALDAIYMRTGLDYFCIDCTETQAGQLLIFEIDHAMVVHAMDPEQLFPYKQEHMLKVKNGFRDYLFNLTGVA